ncbi:MAG: VWA domain-containing protein [Vicinamibacteria bacterium]
MPPVRYHRALTAGIALALLQGRPLPAGDVPPTFEAAVDVIAVDANVVDRDGRPVRDLTADEFAVKVDGRTRRVLSIDFVDLGARAAAPTEGVATEAAVAAAPAAAVRPAGRRIVIVIDRGQIGGSVHQAAAAAGRLLDEMGPEDRVAVFSLPSGPRLDFSADRAAIEKTLGTMGPVHDSVVSEFNISYTEALVLATGRVRAEESVVALRECQRFLGQGGTRPHAMQACALRVEAEARRIVDDQDRSVRDRLNALEALCRALGDVPGPKTLVLVSGGFTSALTGRDYVAPQLRRIANAAAAARISVYSVYFSRRFADMDTSRARENYTPEEDRHLLSAGLGQLTGMAGGALFEAVAGARFAFERVASETSGHYLLSVEAGQRDRDGKPHDIEVRVARQGVDVRSRRQFVMPAAGAPARRAPKAAPTPVSPLRVATSVLRGSADGQIKVVVAAQVEGFKDGRFDIQVLDPRGGVVGKVDASASGPGAPVRHQETLLLPRGVYTLKANVVDATGRTAAVEQPLNAELGHGVGFDVSDLMLLESAEGAMRLPSDRPLAGEKLGVYLELYVQEELPTDRLAVTLDVVGADRVRRSSTALTLRKDADSGLVSAEGEIDAFTLPPGAYVARAVVTFGTRIVRNVERAFVFEGRNGTAPAVTSK